jgi:hypothetical protein
MRPIVIYRSSLLEKEELRAAMHYFECNPSRMAARRGDLVIARYSAVPFYDEQERDFSISGAKMINSLAEHRYVWDMRNWAEDLKGLTPETWYDTAWIPPEEKGPFVLKGQTYSRKQDWKSHCFAKDREAMHEVHWRLCRDGLLVPDKQSIYIRKYVPLKTFMLGLNDMPVTNEFRFFVAYQQILCGAYYWQNYVDELPQVPDANQVPKEFLDKVIKRVGNKIPFYVVDVGETESGDWIVIELNDGQMSGLSCNDPAVLYAQLKVAIAEHWKDQ